LPGRGRGTGVEQAVRAGSGEDRSREDRRIRGKRALPAGRVEAGRSRDDVAVIAADRAVESESGMRGNAREIGGGLTLEAGAALRDNDRRQTFSGSVVVVRFISSTGIWRLAPNPGRSGAPRLGPVPASLRTGNGWSGFKA
jgi:hypothetical protein